MPLSDETRAAIVAIPGDKGWWNYAARDDYVALAADLIGYGLQPEQAVSVLTAAFRVVAEEVGE
ncbi:hypothetical protein ABT340_39540 [Streptosporangium sp. NPDC000239]|uniref:hypothetical protein n=1 Tax=Streptosporangium sp. NPDC000239 TaxID=3154248 RepID=UPI003327F0EC